MPTNGKRIAYGRNQVRVPIATYPDDTSVPVRTSHWNQDPHDQAILGFTKITATLDSSGVIYTKDDSSTTLEDDGNTYSRQSTLIEVECEGTTTTDAIVKIDITDTNENDIVYLYKGTDSDAITIASGTPSVAGHIKTQLSGGATLVHDGVPIMLIRRGDYWYEFGADGAAVAITFTPTSSDTLENKTINTSDNTITVASADVTGLSASLGLKAPIDTPTFTGTVAIPNYSNVETTLDGIATKAPIATPTFTGDVTTASSVLKNQGIAGLAGLTVTTPVSDSIGHVVVAPSGTGTRGQITTSNSSDPSTNGELLAIGSDIYTTNEHAIRTHATGSGTARPLAVYFDTTKVMQITDANGVSITATKKLYLDGGGDTYIYEPSADLSAVVVGNSTKMAWGALGTSIPATQRFYLDGSTPTGDTYLHESSANNIQFVAGTAPILDVDMSGIDVNGTDIDNIQNLVHDISVATTSLNFAGDQLQTISISANTTFSTANLAAGRSKTIKITTDGTLRTFTFPAWKFVGAEPADQAASKVGILTITSFGTTDADCIAAYAVEA